MEHINDLLIFLAKSCIFVLAAVILFAIINAISQKDKSKTPDTLKITPLNRFLNNLSDSLARKVMPKKAYKKHAKAIKYEQKQHEDRDRKRIYVLDFKGDIRASTTDALRHEISALLKLLRKRDEVVCRLESPGGMVHAYGFAASQLARIRDQGAHLTVCIDKIAASGGYLMAAIANTIVAAPYAIIGSIGVVAQLPNFNRLLKRHKIDYEMLTAGEYKRTLSVLGPNTDKGRQKFQAEIDAIHQQFKQSIQKYRPQVDIDKVATGEHWLAEQSFDLRLVDRLITSDDYLLQQIPSADIYQIQYQTKKKFTEKFALASSQAIKAFWSECRNIEKAWWH